MQDPKRVNSKLVSDLKRGNGAPDFFYLMRLIECLHPENLPLGTGGGPEDESVRLGQLPSLKFAESSIASISESSRHGEDLTVLIYFFGLLGSNGPLPLEMTSLIAQRAQHLYDNSPRRFLDIINHRLITLFYRAFAKNELPVNFDYSDSQMLRLFSALTGTGIRRTDRKLLSLSVIRFLSNCNRSRDSLERALSSYFGINLKIEDFKETKRTIPPKFRMRLGNRKTSLLGVNSQIGTHFYSRSSAFCITIGPVSFDESLNFMPGRKCYEDLCEIVRIYLKTPMTFSIVMKTLSSSIRSVVLGSGYALGQSSYLKSENLQSGITQTMLCVPSFDRINFDRNKRSSV